MTTRFLKVFAFAAAVLFASQSAVAGECDTREALFQAAAQAGVPINQEQTVLASSPGVSFAGTSIKGFEQVPATRFPEGVDAGFIFLDAPESGIPAGFYRLNARAQEPRVGTHEGTVSLISLDGKEAARLPASVETWSMEVPSPLPFEQTTMDAQLSSEPGSEEGMLRFRITIRIVIRCPNGSTITITIRF